MRFPKLKGMCILCEKRHGRHRVILPGYLVIGGCRITLPDIIVVLCERCWFRKGLLDFSFDADVEKKLWRLFNEEAKGKD
jgi:hypothetical protein